jgi:hypothetical protein
MGEFDTGQTGENKILCCGWEYQGKCVDRLGHLMYQIFDCDQTCHHKLELSTVLVIHSNQVISH